MKTLKDLAIGESGIVIKLNSTGPTRRRLLDMGLTKGVKVTLRKIAPLGDPLEITLRGYELSLRKSEAELIELEG